MEFLDPAIFLAAMGITLLEISEASAVGLAISVEGGNKAFLYVALGVLIVFVITFAVGQEIARLPILIVRLVAAVLLLYFGLRLARSARRAVIRSRNSVGPKEEGIEKGIFYTGFSVGLVEAFEAAIVLVALIPNNFDSALYGMTAGLIVVVIGTIALKSQVRKIKQANMKVVVSALLLSFSVFWFGEAALRTSSSWLFDLWLIPLFVVFAVAVYLFSHRK
ncbi:MAG: hypothetical protein M1290_00055 [Candidatus Thermoplasmatota archaeon]|jgi:uncharacterized membrane protein|nr:hypothetical protein [Candidatus Thermoplasmatota archaeon]MCL5788845.1 hypothetical protein [Candidatus Thermoplasmatota archaeon]